MAVACSPYVPHTNEIIANSRNRVGEPLNVIVSNNSDPWVLSNYGFTNYSRSLNFRAGDCLAQTFQSNQRANVGDHTGARVQNGLQRYDDGCKEAVNGGNHFRYWFQNEDKHGAVFIAASVEKSAKEHHDIVDNGYDLGRDQLVGNATKSTTKDELGNEYETSVAYDKKLLKDVKKKDINHNIDIDGRVAVLTVKVTKKVSTDGKGTPDDKSAASRAAIPFVTTLLIGVVLAIIPLV